MRKLTGYIGAIIIVFALMGSILLGYALNINGTTATVNAYDPVTDVSGLYTHSQEPAYIDYNPASNYINYSLDDTPFNSDPGTFRMRLVKDTTTLSIDCATGSVTAKGYTAQVNNNLNTPLFMSLKLYCERPANTNIMHMRGEYNQSWTTGTVTLTVSTNSIVVKYNGSTLTTITGFEKVVYFVGDSDNYDYYGINGRFYSDNNDYLAYASSINDVFTYALATPRIGDTANNTAPVLMVGNKWYGENRVNNTFQYGTLTAPGQYTTLTKLGDGVYTLNPNFQNYVTNELGTPVTNRTIQGVCIAYPKSIIQSGIGINYTESNRVNNYPMQTDYDTTTTTQTTNVVLSSISAADISSHFDGILQGTSTSYFWDVSYNTVWYLPTNHAYRLSDVLSTLTIPADTSKIKITSPATITYHSKPFTITSDHYGYSETVYIQYPTLDNWVYILPDGGGAGWADQIYNGARTFSNQNYLIYDLDTHLCDLYNGNGGKIATGPINSFCAYFVNNVSTGNVKTQYFTPSTSTSTTTYDATPRVNPYLQIEYTITGTITNVHYSDITKGYSIKSDNAVPVVWNNTYNNGNIQLLFRAENTPGDYHNQFTIGDNVISIDYTLNNYYITLNGGDPVDIGTWRNIVLDIDLINGKLSAIPVKTFNSYTNVELMNTIIPVGDLVNPAPTNTIEWAPTSNSLKFNVYSTRVNMDTYGVVMVDPSLNIQDYFTNLNNFYRMNFYNFSAYGNSITINGQTSTVTNGTVTYEGETIRLKDLNVTYADGHTYIGDSNIEVDLGATSDYTISMTGAWYFQTMLEEGYTQLKTIYDWDWGAFILDNTQFCVIYMGLALVGLVIARHFCNLSIIDYSVLVISAIIAFTVQVVA